ncbi:MAG: biotin/lipoyl-binding protein, partial [Desulfatitalea sp.]|nr:biotin/lipoyl-binding protein [Desulfatitalea sp.]NNK02110.1 biotin/lipoyl-binding protein [Desulfatitalea sp.]
MKRAHLISLLAIAVLTIAACGGDIQPGNTLPPPGTKIQAATAEAFISQEPFLYEAVATINARTASTVSAKLMGTVQTMHVQEGDTVHKDDLLVTIDPRTVVAQLDQAKAGLREAQRALASAVSAQEAAAAAEELASATARRYEQLLKDNSVSRQEFDEVASRRRQAKATLAQTEAMVEAARSRV